MEKKQQLYSGKAKTLFATEDPNYVIVHYRDDATAFNGVKKASLAHKGIVNNYFNAFIMETLAKNDVLTHFVRLFSDNESIMRRLDMIKVECVVRNIAAGSLCRRLGIKEGLELTPPLFEFFLKDDALGDPLITDNHIISFGWATAKEIEAMKQITLRVNDILKPLFLAGNILLVDYKLEFGRCQGKLLLGDEITPDGCRLWDATTREILDKDRFRKDLGNVIEGYEEVAKRLGIVLPEKLHQ